MGLAVVGGKDDDGRIGEPIGFELSQNLADLRVELGGGVEIFGPVLPCHRVLRVVGRNLHPGPVRMGWGDERAVGLLEIDLREEGPAGAKILPAV